MGQKERSAARTDRDVKAIFLIRLVVGLCILAEALTLLGYLPFFGPQGLSWYWIGYICLYYLILFELPLFLLRRSPYRHLFVFVGYFIALNILFDSLGNILNLFNTTVHYDDFMHVTFFPWAITALTVSLSAIYCKKHHLTKIPQLIVILGFTSAMTLMSFHEIVEMSIDWITTSNAGTAATDIDDTGRDLLFDLTGSLTFVTAFWFLSKKKRQRDVLI